MADAVNNTTCSVGASALSTELRYTILALWAVFFVVSFHCAWAAFQFCWPRFLSFNVSRQADNCSRVNSTIHALIVAPALLYGIGTTSWSSTLEPQDSSSFLQATILVSLGYLIVDLFVVIIYRVPMWVIFAIHHTMALVPYLLYYFTSCNYGLYILSAYMLVEITNVPLNAMEWMREAGNIDGLVYPLLLHLTAAMWVVFRMASPLCCLYVTYKIYLPSVNYPICLWPSQVCGVLVNVFCFAGFFVVIVKNISEYWRRPANSETAKPLM
ncbi:hypothetical protein ABL78_0680 [Leptomonas seymouri]|uniref:TLC domain-containing protein n=1 Tax=Leptomonas seymouri TaxID=5684 RepID=A0A0N1PFA4_LEPSE|nr:hypothetical protein ABL78_0680 [Leptomonas seymouri]|eukprot:KPI90162.1 hypothetical protein ABL78_0680 [Leptomonas seymouri]